MPFFGVPIRNGLPIGLGSVAGFGVQQFDPSQLFAGGTVAGAWYDPSDLSTMFDTSAGTTPVAMPGLGAPVPVGLMLDKSQGLVLGANDITGFTPTIVGAATAATYNSTTGAGTAARVDGSNLSYLNKTGLTSNRVYRITVTNTGSSSLQIRQNGTAVGLFIVASGTTVTGLVTTYTHTDVSIVPITNGTTIAFTIVSLQQVSGNHAIAFNDTTARPELRARVNLLTYSEEFNNGVWIKNSSTVTANAAVSPNGTVTAEKFIPDNGSASGVSSLQQDAVSTVSTRYVYSVYLKAAEYTSAEIRLITRQTSGGVYIGDQDLLINLTDGTFTTASAGTPPTSPLFVVDSVGNGWYRASISAITNNNAQGIRVHVNNLTTGDGTSGIYIWGADLRPANIGANVPAYQRIADANTYDTSGFPLYLFFDGFDDGMNVPGSASAMKFMHSALSSVCLGVNVGISADPNAIYAFFGNNALSSANVGVLCAYDDRTSLSINNALRNFTTNGVSGFPTISTLDQNVLLPVTPNVVFYNSDPANATAANRYTAYVNNGSALATNTSTDAASTANSTYDLQIGAHGNSLSLALMSFYGLVIVNATITGGQRTATQSWIAGKMGITLP